MRDITEIKKNRDAVIREFQEIHKDEKKSREYKAGYIDGVLDIYNQLVGKSVKQ